MKNIIKCDKCNSIIGKYTCEELDKIASEGGDLAETAYWARVDGCISNEQLVECLNKGCGNVTLAAHWAWEAGYITTEQEEKWKTK